MPADVVRCATARRALSAVHDGEPGAVLPAEHLAACPACAAHRARLDEIRRALRFEVVDEIPDLAGAVARRLADPAAAPVAARPAPVAPAVRRHPDRRRNPVRRPRWAAVAAAFVVGALVGGAVVAAGPGRQTPTVHADLADRVVAAQADLDRLSATLTVEEDGWSAAVPVRHFTGTLRYSSPETLALHLTDGTAYPPGPWVPNDVDVVVDGSTAWSRGPAGCPATSQPACNLGDAADEGGPGAAGPRVQATVDRPPFADADDYQPGADGQPVPLDLVLPVRAFTDAADDDPVPVRTVAGRSGYVVHTTVAAMAPLLDGLRAAGNWRALHPTDPVEAVLDRQTLVPLSVTVTAADGADRARWAAEHGYPDRPGAVVFSVRFDDVVVNGPALDPPPPAPADAVVRDLGFADAPAGVSDGTGVGSLAGAPTPAVLPARMAPTRRGVQQVPGGPAVAVQAWAAGRAWLTVRSTSGWMGQGLFGDLPRPVRRVDLDGAGVAFVGAGGTRVALHADGLDVVVAGSVSSDVLVAVVRSLGLVGRDVPPTWAEAATATQAQAQAVLPGLLLPQGLAGYGPPAFRIADGRVVVAQTGPGDTGFELDEAAGTDMGDPTGVDAQEVAVGDGVGRLRASAGTLELVRDGVRVIVRSPTATADELVAIARALGSA